MKPYLLLLLIPFTVFSSCKKDNNSGQNKIEFDIDGVHHSFTPNEAHVAIDTFSTGLFKAVQIAYSRGSFPFFALALGEDISNPLDDCLITGNYPGAFYTSGCNDSTAGNCQNFNFVYGDSNGCGVAITCMIRLLL